MLRDFGIALSLTNLLFLAAWSDQASMRYFLKAPPRPLAPMGLIVDVLAVAALLVALVRIARRLTGPWAKASSALVHLAFLAALLVPLDWIRRQATGTSFDGITQLVSHPGTAVIAVVITVAACGFLIRSLRPVSHGAAWVLLALLPLLLVTVGTSAMQLVKSPAPIEVPRAPAHDGLRAPAALRIVWFLFDELDERTIFVARDPTLALPELDRLRAQSLFATHAYSPSRLTLSSVPALLTGKSLNEARVEGFDLLLNYQGTADRVPWSRQRSIMSDARQAGLDTHIVGWYDSYCRVLEKDLTTCSWEAYRPEADDDFTVSEALMSPIVQVVAQLPLANRYGIDTAVQTESYSRARRSRHLAAYRRTLASAVHVATGAPGFLYVHWPVPHAPFVYDRRRGEFAFDGDSSYLDNVALVDRTLGEMRRAMEHAGVWDAAIVLVTADHSWRMAPIQDYRVPFLLKLPGQSSSVEYGPAFTTTVIRFLLQALISGEVDRPDGVAAWLDRHRDAHPLPASAIHVEP